MTSSRRNRSSVVAGLGTVLILSMALLISPSSLAQTGSTSFGSGEEAPAPALVEAAPGDFEAMLKNCDAQLTTTSTKLEACKRDETGIDFLAWAYIAAWVILAGFFFLVRMKQVKLTAEMAELRARLARLNSEDPR